MNKTLGSIAFGIVFAVLVVLALSVPIAPTGEPGHNITLLQFATASLTGNIVAIASIVALVLVVRWLFKDRRHEREIYGGNRNMQRNQFNDYSVSSPYLPPIATQPPQKPFRSVAPRQQLSKVQKAFIINAIQAGASLVMLEDGSYGAESFDGDVAALSNEEANYWLRCEQMLGNRMLPEGRN